MRRCGGTLKNLQHATEALEARRRTLAELEDKVRPESILRYWRESVEEQEREVRRLRGLIYDTPEARAARHRAAALASSGGKP